MLEKKLHSTALEPETCVLIGLAQGRQNREEVDEHLEELAFLAKTADAINKRTFVQSLNRPDTRTFIGSGKLQTVKDYVEEHEIDILIGWVR